jgi:recombination protein RecT
MSTPTPPRANSRLNYDQSSKAIQQSRPATAIAVINEHKEFLTARMAKIAEWVTHGLRPEALVRFVLRDMDGDRGARLRESTKESIYLGLLACAVTGLEPGALKGEAYLVPYKNKGVMEATFMPGYRGIIKQARRSREVAAIWSNVVYEGDEFDIDLGTANRIVHRPRLGSRTDNIIAAYAIARMSSGQDEIELMDRDDLDAVRKAGNQGPAWDAWADQMMRKAPIRRLGKRLPLGADYYVALALDNAPDANEQRRIINVETSDESARADAQAQSAAEMAAQASSASDPTDAELLAHEAELNRREGQR